MYKKNYRMFIASPAFRNNFARFDLIKKKFKNYYTLEMCLYPTFNILNIKVIRCY